MKRKFRLVRGVFFRGHDARDQAIAWETNVKARPSLSPAALPGQVIELTDEEQHLIMQRNEWSFFENVDGTAISP